ncbi:MAG: tRNA (adenosine(37)-N6)-threonylcarbamoyltransferase complex dimerization subunit type 1 TsaB [Burkholderiales bacterium]
MARITHYGPPAPPLNLLALETSTDYCSVALLAGDTIACKQECAGQRHSEIVLPMIDALLNEAALKPVDLDGVAFGAGPGSFTGLRIACGVAQGIAFAHQLPVAPVGTLEALAQAAGGERVIASLDARMGEIYFAAFQRQERTWQVLVAPSLCRPGDAPALPDSGWIGCGSGFDRYREALSRRYAGQLAAVREDLYPHAREIAVLGRERLAAGQGVSAERAAPLYVREKVALKMHEQR